MNGQINSSDLAIIAPINAESMCDMSIIDLVVFVIAGSLVILYFVIELLGGKEYLSKLAKKQFIESMEKGPRKAGLNLKYDPLYGYYDSNDKRNLQKGLFALNL